MQIGAGAEECDRICERCSDRRFEEVPAVTVSFPARTFVNHDLNPYNTGRLVFL